MGTLSSTYYDRLIDHTNGSFTNLVQIREPSNDDIKIRKIKDYEMLFERLSSGVGGSTIAFLQSTK